MANVPPRRAYSDEHVVDRSALPSLNDIYSFTDVDAEKDFGSLLAMIDSDVPALERQTPDVSSSDSEPEAASPKAQPAHAVAIVPVEPPLRKITIIDVTPKSALRPTANLPAPASIPAFGVTDAFNFAVPAMPSPAAFTPYAPSFAGSYFPFQNPVPPMPIPMPMQPMNHFFQMDAPLFDPRITPTLMQENAFMHAQLEMQSYAISQMMAALGSQQLQQKPTNHNAGRVPRTRQTPARHAPYARKPSFKSAHESSASDLDESDFEQLVTGWHQPSLFPPSA